MARSIPSIRSSARGLALLASAASVAVGLTACSSSDSGSADDAITVGVPIADTSSLAKAGVAEQDALSTGDIEDMYRAAFDTVSGTAAAGGHTLEADFSSFDLVQPAAPQTSCLHFVQDSRDDVVLSTQFVNGGDQCVVQRGGFLLQNVAAPQAAYSMSPGRVYTLDLLPEDAAHAFADYLTNEADLDGQTVGVLTDALGGDAAPVTDIVVPALEKAGITVAHVTTLTADLSQVAQQIPVEVAQMKDAGVTTIIDATPSANFSQFLGGMAKAGWNVPVIASDLNNAVDETFAKAYPADLHATAVTARRFGDTDQQSAATTCYDNYLKAGGKELTPGSVNYQRNLQICDSVSVLAAGLAQLGDADFSAKSFAEALSGVGTLDLGFYGPSGLSGDARSTVQGVREVTWTQGTWQPSGTDWIPVTGE